ncbi:hypothetical protein P280DRAFT_191635 [Massarina eburnea CBS 473.64]|uniref:F-box domain-containing protein n=1 Tax=Massarina eburnea CBS 473.64 TaxID=1395130 RepID=A0A6A6RN70_9PLEO|nr:hypothetical protein P280DRAFT_191635 [Massarina eburnea CBS 473.64]
MNNSRAALGLLPTELLHRIAASLPCSSILNVCFTSRNLYAALYDRHVFKRSAVNVLYVDKYIRLPPLDDVQVESWELESCASEASEENSEDEWWPNLEEQDLDPEDDWDHADWGPDARQRKAIVNNDWDMNWPQASIFDALTAGDGARIAFAAEKANRIFNVCLHAQPWNRMVQWERESLVNWLPHLITLGHNSAMDLRPETFQLILWAPDILEVIENQDGVIHPIHLSLREPEQNDPTEAIAIISSDSHGEDSWGPFTIAGSFFQDGEVWLVRSYEPHITEELATDTSPSNFRGIVTPFGIVGSWEVDRWTSPHYKRHIRLWYGFFWIWKKEWCRPWLEC